MPKCKVCGRELRDPASIARGAGPECSGQHGKTARRQAGQPGKGREQVKGQGIGTTKQEAGMLGSPLKKTETMAPIELVALGHIWPCRWQPRQVFEGEALWQLAQSVRDNGLINPVIVFKVWDEYEKGLHFELVAGERRTRALVALALAKLFPKGSKPEESQHEWVQRLAIVGLAGLDQAERAALMADPQPLAPARIEPNDELEHLHLLAVLENLERADLSPLEEARGYQGLQAAYGWSQRELAARLGKSQGYVAQRLALLTLAPAAVEALNTRVIGLTEARAIAAAPQAVQPALTEWAKSAMSKDTSPATARQVETRARQVAAFVEPARWEPTGNPDAYYTPQMRNRLAVLRHAVTAWQKTPSRAESILALADTTDYHNNVLNMAPKTIVSGGFYIYQNILKVLGYADTHNEAWERYASDEITCETCVFKDIELQTDGHVEGYCPHWQGKQLMTCDKHLGAAEPQIIPLEGYSQRRGLSELGAPVVDEPEPHMTDAAEYVRYLTQMVEQAQQKDAQRQAQAQTRHLDAIKAFQEWQAGLSVASVEHCHGQFCSKCAFYAPLYTAEGLPGCQWAKTPLTDKFSNTTIRPPVFGMWVDREGHCLPRCEMFAYAELPRFNAALTGTRIPDHDLVVAWLRELGKAGGSYDGLHIHGILTWLHYGRKPGQPQDWDKLIRFVKRMWQETWNDGEALLLIELARQEGQLRQSYHLCVVINILNPNTGAQEGWVACTFPPSQPYRSSESWPAGYPKPWEAPQPKPQVTPKTLVEVFAEQEANHDLVTEG
jgi:ParB-like chromosome segregation protein Spo0J